MTAALLVLCLSACGASRDEVIVASGSSVVPVETLEDWVTYGDHLVELTVLDERRIPPTDEEVQRKEGTIGRKITVKVTDVLWTRSTLRKDIKLPAQFVTGGGFWAFKGKKETRVVIEDAPWLEVGQHYLAVVAYIDPEFGANPNKPKSEARPEWGPLICMAFDGAAVAPASRAQYTETSAARTATSGKTAPQIGQMLKATPPNPKAKDYMSEDPALRFQRVAASE